MVGVERKKLEEWDRELERELETLEKQRADLDRTVGRAREQLDAVRKLLGSDGSAPQPAKAPAAPATAFMGESLRSRKRSPYTPAHLYWPAILSVLVGLGGAAAGEDVIDRVGQKLENVLTPADRERLSSGVEVRWRNRAQWQRYNMGREGLLKRDSPRGIWEITEEGMRWLADFEKRAQAGPSPRT